MLSFSQRMGLKSIKSLIQTDSMDKDLRTALWNVLHENIWTKVQISEYGDLIKKDHISVYLIKLWKDFYKLPLHNLPSWSELFDVIQSFYSRSPWNEVYDFIEFTVQNMPIDSLSDKINEVLKRELSAYRLVDKELLKITADEEVEEIEQATQINSTTHYASTHIKEALKLLADKKNPDYRNSIKESISAVEAICTAITKASGNDMSTLGAALKAIEKEGHIELHPALKGAFDKLYGYTSDDGIRHFLKNDKEVNFEDAKFMLVACSAFVNYLTEKSGKAGISL